MRIRLALTLDVDRRRADAAPSDIVEHQGAHIEASPQPRYIGFVPEK